MARCSPFLCCPEKYLRLPGRLRHISFDRCLLQVDLELLRNHVVLGRPILPATGYFDLVHQAMRDGAPALPWSVRDAFWFAPLEVRPEVRVEVDTGGAYRVGKHASGVLGSDGAAGAALRCAGPTVKLSGAEAYAIFDRSGIAYGPLLRCLEWYRHGPAGAMGRLVRQGQTGSACFPDILDAAVQCALLWVRQQRPEADVCVPFSLKQMVVAAVPGPWCDCVLVLRGEARDGRSYFSFDLQLMNEDGDVLVEMKEL